MNELYESDISTARWIAYDLPGNAGWITWIVCMVLCLKERVTVFAVLALIPAILMLIGVAELVSERIARLDRVLPRRRLLRGFGTLTLGGILGVPTAVIGLLLREYGCRPLWMGIGAVLCAVFAGLICRTFRKQTSNRSLRCTGGNQ